MPFQTVLSQMLLSRRKKNRLAPHGPAPSSRHHASPVVAEVVKQIFCLKNAVRVISVLPHAGTQSISYVLTCKTQPINYWFLPLLGHISITVQIRRGSKE
jgi:hypothetical protein